MKKFQEKFLPKSVFNNERSEIFLFNLLVHISFFRFLHFKTIVLNDRCKEKWSEYKFAKFQSNSQVDSHACQQLMP